MIYAIGKKEKLARYSNEHHFTWVLFQMIGHLTGIALAYIVYNYLYSKEAFALIIVILMVFFVLHAYFLQKLEMKLNNK